MITTTKPPILRPSAESRGRKYVTYDEMRDLARAAGSIGRLRHRDATMIRLAFVHGFRVSEIVALKCHHVDLRDQVIQIKRVKGSNDSTHPLMDDEVKALAIIMGEYRGNEHVFRSDLGCGMATNTFHGIVARAGVVAGIPWPVNPHALRHGCGYHLINSGRDIRMVQAWLGHRNIQHTVEYTALCPHRFKDFWPMAATEAA